MFKLVCHCLQFHSSECKSMTLLNKTMEVQGTRRNEICYTLQIFRVFETP